MTQIIGGHNLGLLDGSSSLLNRNDQTGVGTLGHGAQAFANVSNGNLLFQEQDIFLPSSGQDFDFIRTYNSRGVQTGAKGWLFSPNITLQKHSDKLPDGTSTVHYLLTYADGSALEYVHDAARNLWISTDGAGAFETLQVLAKGQPNPGDKERYLVTRADGSQYLFDFGFDLQSVTDTNGVATTFDRVSGRVTVIRDDTGHVLTLGYDDNRLISVTDEGGQVLVRYTYVDQLLTKVTDRFGHVTTYRYNKDKLLDLITLPDEQIVDGVTTGYAQRTIAFTYAKVTWGDHPHHLTDFDKGDQFVVTQIVDSEGGTTSFEYSFQRDVAMASSDRDAAFAPTGGVNFTGGTTRVVDALGNARAYSNDAQYKAWRAANGYYETYTDYNPKNQAAQLAEQTAQAALIRNPQSVVYTYDANGQITRVTDELGFQTSYVYDFAGNLTSITDASGFGAVSSDSAYYRALRAELGFSDSPGVGKLSAALTEAEKASLLAMFTSTFTYDGNGNLLTSTDNAGNVTTYTYTAFNKVATVTSALDHETRFDYDARQNLTRRTDALGNVVEFQYDANGNLTHRIVYLDKDDLTDTDKQQITVYGYDAFGNNTRITDGEGNVTTKVFDHFGNVTASVDGRGELTSFVYDADNRLLSETDPMGHRIRYAYDAVGNQIAVTDANGHTITRVFDRNNLLLATIDAATSDAALNRSTLFQYDVLGNGTRRTDAEGRVTTYTYDAHRQLVDVRTDTVPDASGALVSYHETLAYDGLSNVVRSTDRNGNRTDYLLTVNGQTRRVTDAVGNVTEYTYDADLRQVQVIVGAQVGAALRRVLTFGYDDTDRQLSESDDYLPGDGKISEFVYDAAGNIVSATDGNGHTTNFEFDRNNRMLREIHPEVVDPVTGLARRDTIEHRYDENGNETSTTDENGRTTTLYFDRDNRVVLVTDANHVNTVLEYDSRDNRTSVRIGVAAHFDAATRQVLFDPPVADDASDPQVSTFAYDEFNQLVATTDGVGNALATSDDTLYQALRVESGFAALVADLSDGDKAALRNRHTERSGFDRVGNEVTTSDNLGRVTTTTYDKLNRIVSVTEGVGTAVERTATYRYDGNDNLVTVADALGRVTRLSYDAADRVTEVKDPLAVVARNEYDNVGNLTARTLADATADARRTEYVYDLRSRLISETDPLNRSKAYAYDAVGNRLKVTDSRLGETRFLYDARDRNVKIIDPLSFETVLEYDGVGNRIAVVDANQGITRLVYDAANRYIETTDAEGRVTKFDYDVVGNAIRQTTAFGTAEAQTTEYLYDAVGNLRKVTDAEHGVTTAGFDQVYNVTRATDANGNTTTYAFDALNRRFRVTDALSQTTMMGYDAADNVLTETDALGRIRSFTYDANDQVLSEVDPLGNRTGYSYDGVGNQVSITRPGGRVTTLVYDKGDRLESEIDPLGQRTRYQYDANDNVTRVTDANDNHVVYGYDANDQVTSITDMLGGVVAYAYDGNGNRVRVSDENGHVTTSYFNANDETVLTVDPTGFVATYAYDNNGNLVSRTDYLTRIALPVSAADDPASLVPTGAFRTTRFSYDGLNRLTHEILPLVAVGAGPTPASVNPTTITAYDAVGNVVSRTDANSHTTRYAYDDVNRLVAQVTAQGFLTTFEYDAAGNLTAQYAYQHSGYALGSDGVISPTPPATGDVARITRSAYDANDRLLSRIDAALVTTTYEYDAVGNRTAEVEAFGTAGARRRETGYDLADRVFETKDAAGVVTRYQLDAVGNVLERFDAWGSSDQRKTSFAYDALNRMTMQTDALLHQTKYEYDAVGNITVRTSAFDLPAAQRRVEHFEYDANDRMTVQRNGLDERTDVSYDAVGNRIKIVVAQGLPEERVNEFAYDADDRLVAETDGEGVITAYRYDAAGNTVEVVQAAGASGQERSTTMTYGADNRLLTVRDPMGHVTAYEYDDLGNQTRIVDADGTETHNSFDILGRLSTNTAAAVGGERGGIATTNTYDAFGNVLTSTQRWVQPGADNGDARATTYAYDALDRQTRVTDGEGFSTAFEYDVFGNMTRIVRGEYLGADTAKRAAAHEYDLAAGSRGGYETDLTYDAMNRLLLTTDGQGNLVASTYDALGNRITQTTGGKIGADLTHESRQDFAYDLAGRMTERRSPTGGVVQLSYDQAGNLTRQMTLQRGQVGGIGTNAPVWSEQNYQYDGNGRVIASIDSFSTRTEFRFDAFGNQTAITHAKGTPDERTVVFEYDLDNNRTSEIEAVAYARAYSNEAEFGTWRSAHGYATNPAALSPGDIADILDTQRTRFAYDAVGDMVKETDAHGNVTRHYYDALRRLAGTLDANNFFTGYTHDAAGNTLTSTVYMNAVPGTVSDPDPMPAPGLNAAIDRVTTSVFDRANRVTRRTAPDGGYKVYEYDSTDKLLRIKEYGSTDSALAARTAPLVPGGSATDPLVKSWVYDDSGRISVFTNVDGVTETYEYDAANNKITETIHNPHPLSGGRIDPDRTTYYAYDLDNRLIQQLFDPAAGSHFDAASGLWTLVSGASELQLEQRLGYDSAGNVVVKTDGAGNTSVVAYDRENRIVRVTDPLLDEIDYAYDRRGNVVAATDARNLTINTVYDKNNRAVSETSPNVEVYHWVGSQLQRATVTPTTTTTYDDLGNLRQFKDAGGNVTTYWYDAAGNMIAERNGNGAVRGFSYDAVGALVTATQDMAFNLVAVADVDLDDPPALSSEVRTATNLYDLGGRVASTTFSEIDVTTVTGTAGISPAASTAPGFVPVVVNRYDAFGNLVESIDAGGNSIFAWYDQQGRQVATVDAGGYLVETHFDDQGNVVQQRKYATPLAGPFNSALRPTPPGGVVVAVDRVYDAAGRMIEEISAPVHTSAVASDVRVVTRFAYDGAGNLISKTLGEATIDGSGTRTPGGSNARTEHYYYDGAGRRVAVVASDRVLSVFGYDANGNLTSQKRYFDTIDGALPLTATRAQLEARVVANPGADQELVFAYDSANRMIGKTESMDLAKTSDNLVEKYGYDENGNRTYSLNPDGYNSPVSSWDNFATKTRFDAAGQAVETVSPNGSHSFIEYDTGGFKVKAYIGGDGSNAPEATTPSARIANASGAPLEISWQQSGTGVTSWVAWDVAPRTNPSAGGSVPSPAPGVPGATGASSSYAHASGAYVGSGVGSALIDLSSASSSTIYFRIMSRDAAGNLAWTAEQSVYVPPRITSMALGKSGALSTVTVSFASAVTSGALALSSGASPANYSAVASNGGATWTFTFSGSTTDAFHVAWTDGATDYRTADLALLAPSVHSDGGNGWVTWPLPTDGTAPIGNDQLILVDGVLRPDPGVMGSIDGVLVEAQTSIRSVTGQLEFLAPALAADATVSYDAIYGTLSNQTHTASISFTQRQSATATLTGVNTAGEPAVIVSSNFSIAWQNEALRTHVGVELNPDESSNVGVGGVKVSHRAAQGGVGGFTDAAADKAGNVYSKVLTLSPGSTYDVKVWYLDTSGREVIVEWRRVSVPANATLPAETSRTVLGAGVPPAPATLVKDLTPGTATTFTGDHSITVLARETGGSITRTSQGSAPLALSIVAGVYTGPVDPGASSMLLVPKETANNQGGVRTTNGAIAQTYYTEIVYNAMGVKIATNEDSGLWRRLGVDANGNVVQTSLYGTQQAEIDGLAPIVSYKAYDKRNLEIASFGADVDAGRAVTRTTYDFASRVKSVNDPGFGSDRTFSYDGVGNVIRSTDGRGYASTTVYNVFGQVISETDGAGHTRTNVYNASGWLMQEHVSGVSDSRYYNYDAFGRRIQVANGQGTRAANGNVSGNVTSYAIAYDQGNRVTSVADLLGGTTNYHYDGRDNLLWTEDANGNWFGAAYDAMGQVTHRYSFQTRVGDAIYAGGPSTLQEATAAVATGSAGTGLVVETTTYDLFGNKIAESDGAGRTRSYSYGAFARLGSITTGDVTTVLGYDRFGNKDRETSNYGKNIFNSYDKAGKLTRVNDIGTGTRTDYGYDVAGRRDSEQLFQGGSKLHDYSYAYNGNGWMTGWSDSVTGIGESMLYDGAGNVSKVTGAVAGNANYVVHDYSYDAADRALSAAGTSYSYDVRGRRWTAYDGTSTVRYTYDNADRLLTAQSYAGLVAGTQTATATGTLTWTYDSVGNVKSVGDGTDSTTYSYDSNNVSYKSVGDSTSTTYTDKSGRVLKTVTSSDGSTYTYNYAYNADGTEKSVSATGTGSVTGSTVSSYDVNRKLSNVNLGTGDTASAVKNKSFKYDNQGHIVKATFDSTTTNYLYANDQPVGEYESAATPTLDEGNYAVVRTVVGTWGESGPDFPSTAISSRVVAAGETLQSIAGSVYGHPELWFVIADANGLTGSEQLKPGMRLSIPNSVQYAGFTSETHALYKEGEIVGSKLPNLKSPPPPEEDECAKITAIVLIVVVTLVAIAATVFTAGALGPAAFAAVAATYGAVAGVIAAVVVTAAVGALIAFAASVATQGILIGFGLQDSFDWDAVAADTVAGAFSGAAVGLGAIVATASKVTTLARVANAVAQVSLEVGGEMTRQYVLNGGINDWTGVAIAGAAGGLGAAGDLAVQAGKANQAAAKSLGAIEKLGHAQRAIRSGKAVGRGVAKAAGEVAQTGLRGVKGVAGAAGDVAQLGIRGVKAAGSGLKSFAKAAAEYVSNSRIVKYLTPASKAADAAKESGRVVTVLKTAGNALKNAGKYAAEYVAKVGTSIATGLKSAGTVAAGAVKNAAKSAAEYVGNTKVATLIKKAGSKVKPYVGLSLKGIQPEQSAKWADAIEASVRAAAKSESAVEAGSKAARVLGARPLGGLATLGDLSKATELAAKGARITDVGYALKAAGAAAELGGGIWGTFLDPPSGRDRDSSFNFGAGGGTGNVTAFFRVARTGYNTLKNVGDASEKTQNARRDAWLAQATQRQAGIEQSLQASGLGNGAKQAVDTDRATVFARERDTGHRWVPTGWLDTATSSVAQIVTHIAGLPDLQSIVSYSRLLAGETGKFDAQAVVELTAGTSGRVGTNPVPLPIVANSPLSANPYAA